MKAKRKLLRPLVVSFLDLKAQLCRLLQEGVEWTIAERGKQIARLVPFAQTMMSLCERVRQFEDNGTIEAAIDGRVRTPTPLSLKSGVALRMLEADRDSSA